MRRWNGNHDSNPFGWHEPALPPAALEAWIAARAPVEGFEAAAADARLAGEPLDPALPREVVRHELPENKHANDR